MIHSSTLHCTDPLQLPNLHITFSQFTDQLIQSDIQVHCARPTGSGNKTNQNQSGGMFELYCKRIASMKCYIISSEYIWKFIRRHNTHIKWESLRNIWQEKGRSLFCGEDISHSGVMRETPGKARNRQDHYCPMIHALNSNC